MKPLIVLLALMAGRDAALDPPKPLGPWRKFVNEVLEDHNQRIHQLEHHVAELTKVNQRQNELIEQLNTRLTELETQSAQLPPQPVRHVTTHYRWKRCGLFRWRLCR